MYDFRSLRACCAAVLVICLATGGRAEERRTENVFLVTIDGLRWQEVFLGADQRLLDRESGGVRNVEELRARFWSESAENRRSRLMPFLWETLAAEGQLFGDPSRQSLARVTNGRYFSYPGYNEILSGYADDRIDSNAKRPNPNVTVLEWLHRRPAYEGRVAAFASWDVFPYIVNSARSGVYVNAGWQPLERFGEGARTASLNEVAAELPHYWDSVRYDIFTIAGALAYLRQRRPRVLYVALGETDDWAHEGRYDLYLDAARRSDRYLRQLWEVAQQMDDYRGKTSFVITTDHGRGDGRESWKSHGAEHPSSDLIWIAVLGPDTPARGIREASQVSQSQVAATVASLLGEDFAGSDPRVAAPLPGVLGP